MLEGNLATARARLEEGLGMYRELDDRFWIAACLLYTGYVDCKEGDHAAAHSRFARLDETLPLLQFPWSIPYLLEGFAWVAAAQGHPKRALGMGGRRTRCGEPSAYRSDPPGGSIRGGDWSRPGGRWTRKRVRKPGKRAGR